MQDQTANDKRPASSGLRAGKALAALAALLVLAACQPPVKLMPPPALFVGTEPNLFDANANLDRSDRIQVFYATNRKPNASDSYSIFPGEMLHMGVATLSIGEGSGWDRVYELSTSNSTQSRPRMLLDSMDRQASVPLDASVEDPGPEALAFFGSIDEALARATDKDLTIYVHGANTGVVRASGQAAQYRHFTGRNSVVLSYMWPSAENFLRFGHDVKSSAQTAPAFAQLVRLLARHTKAAHINVIAYSSGASVASPGLALLGTPAGGYDPRSLRLGEVYFPAPDADFRSFVNDVRVYHQYPRRITVTVNMNDSVLALSRLHQRGSRVGRPDPGELSAEDTEWLIGASNQLGFDLLSARSGDLPGMSRRSHIFWYDDPWVSSDVVLKLVFHLPPQDRGLVENQRDSDLEFWTFPEDYEARMQGIRRQLVEAAREASSQGASRPLPE